MTVPLSSDWSVPPSTYTLQQREVLVWRLDLNSTADVHDRLRSWLSEDELVRADRLVREEDGRKFTTARGTLRGLLSRYLDCEPAELLFRQLEYGKPVLETASSEIPVSFNVSHSGDVGLIAVTLDAELGVDVEVHRERLEADKIARRYFSPGEVQKLFSLPEKDREQAFYNCWTRKEAYIKARGEGLSLGLNNFEVSLGPDDPPALLRAKDGEEELRRWSFYDLHPGEGYTGALAVEGNPDSIRLYDLHGSDFLYQ